MQKIFTAFAFNVALSTAVSLEAEAPPTTRHIWADPGYGINTPFPRTTERYKDQPGYVTKCEAVAEKDKRKDPSDSTKVHPMDKEKTCFTY